MEVLEEATASVIRAIAVEYDVNSSVEARRSAAQDLEKVKAGDVRTLVRVGLHLVDQKHPQELRHYGLGLLQHVAHARWSDLSESERTELAKLAVQFLGAAGVGASADWALKSKASALVAEILRQQGPAQWQQGLGEWQMFSAVYHVATTGPVGMELVALVLQFLPEDVTVFNEDLDGNRRRELLLGLKARLNEILPFLCKVVELSLSQAMEKWAANQMAEARVHVAPVSAAVNAMGAYATWAPLPALHSHRVIHVCGYLLGLPDFRSVAVRILKDIAARKRQTDETLKAFAEEMGAVLSALTCATETFLGHAAGLPGDTSSSSAGEAEMEFGEELCEALVALGSSNFHSCIALEHTRCLTFLQQMLRLMQLSVMKAHIVPFWLVMLRETVLVVDGQTIGGAAGVEAGKPGAESKKKSTVVVPSNFLPTLLDAITASITSIKCKSDDDELLGDNPPQLARSLDILKYVSSQQPALSAQKAAHYFNSTLATLTTAKATSQMVCMLEASQTILEAIVGGLPESALVSSASAGFQDELGSGIQGVAQQVLDTQWQQAMELIPLQARHLEALGPFLKHSPTLLLASIQKLFSLLSLLPVLKEGVPKSVGVYRVQVCRAVTRVARASDSALVSHMEEFATCVKKMQAEASISHGEYNVLIEALLYVAAAAGREQQAQVLEWLLQPVRQKWVQPEWQVRYLTSSEGLVSMMVDTQAEEVAQWLFHSISLFEKIVRGAFRHSPASPPSSLPPPFAPMPGLTSDLPPHPLSQHLPWILPPLLQVLKCIHGLWSLSARSNLADVVAGALDMPEAEKQSLLGEARSSTSSSSARPSTVDDSMGPASTSSDDATQPTAATLSQRLCFWIKGIRENLYNILQLSMVHVPSSFFEERDGRPAQLADALVGDLPSLHVRVITQVVRMVVTPLVKACAPAGREVWVGPVLGPLLRNCQVILSRAWQQLAESSLAGPPVAQRQAIGTELLQEICLRSLTREVCGLLATLATSSSSSAGTDNTSAGAPDAPASSAPLQTSSPSTDSLLGFLTEHAEAAQAAAVIAMEALTWPDKESVHRALVLCSALVGVAVAVSAQGHADLREFVARTLFHAALRGLTLDSNAVISAELVALIRDIFLRLQPLSSTPHEVLLSLASPQAVQELELALTATNSAKKQQKLLASLLMNVGGPQLKALAPTRSAPITNTGGHPSSLRGTTSTNMMTAMDDHTGLAAMFGHA